MKGRVSTFCDSQDASPLCGQCVHSSFLLENTIFLVLFAKLVKLFMCLIGAANKVDSITGVCIVHTALSS